MTFLNDDLNFDLIGGEDLEDDSDESYHYGGVEARVFLVDAHRRMFDNKDAVDDDGTKDVADPPRSYFVDVLNSILVSVQRRVFHSNTSLYAVVLYGTKKSKNAYNFDGVFVLQDLNLIDPNRIHELEEVIERGDQQFDDDLGHADKEVSLGDALHTASILFEQCPTRLGEKRVFLFTNDHDPHVSDVDARRKALAKAADLKELHHDITLIPLKPSSQTTFDPRAFYKDLLQLADEETEELERRTTSSWEELESRLKGLEDKRRRLAAFDFDLGKVKGQSVSLSVGLYSMVREKPDPNYIYRSSRDNSTEVKSVTRKFLGGEDGDGTSLIPSDVKKGISYGGRNLLFEMDELTKIKDFGGTSGMQLLGFKPLARLFRHHHIGPSSFLYPDEASTEGSIRLFVALLQKCRERKKFVLVRIVPRQHSAPIMAALIPQEEERGEDGFQIFPSGFWVKPLPYADDLRDLSTVVPLSAQDEREVEETNEITDRIVKKLTFKFDPRNFENPHLRNLYGIIESMALEKNEYPVVEDSTHPPNERIDKKIGGLCEDWKEVVWPSGYDPQKPPSTKRTTTATTSEGAAKKKVKTEDIADGAPTVADMMKAAEEKRLAKLTVPVLKGFCRGNSIACKGTKKDDFISAIGEYFGIE